MLLLQPICSYDFDDDGHGPLLLVPSAVVVGEHLRMPALKHHGQ